MKIFRNIIFLGIISFAFACEDEVAQISAFTPCDEVLQGWSITYNSTPSVFNATDIFFLNEEAGYAVGKNGTISKTMTGGRDWDLLEYHSLPGSGINPNSLTRAFLETVYFVDSLTGFVGGRGEFSLLDDVDTYAVFLKTNDGGDTWQKTYLDSVDVIYDLAFYDKNHGIGSFSVTLKNNYSAQQLRITHDGGETWTHRQLPEGRLKSIQILEPSDCIQIIMELDFQNHTLWTSCDDGLTWQPVILPVNTFRTIQFMSDEIWLIDALTERFADGVWKTTDGGNTWTEINMPSGPISAVHFYNGNEGFVIRSQWNEGTSGGEWYSFISSYEIYQTDDGGETWKVTLAGHECDFYGLQYSYSSNLVYLLSDAFIKFEKL